MDILVVYFITRVSRPAKLKLPTTISAFAIDLISILKATWKSKEP